MAVVGSGACSLPAVVRQCCTVLPSFPVVVILLSIEFIRVLPAVGVDEAPDMVGEAMESKPYACMSAWTMDDFPAITPRGFPRTCEDSPALDWTEVRPAPVVLCHAVVGAALAGVAPVETAVVLVVVVVLETAETQQ